MTTPSDAEDVVPLFIPALIAKLFHAERTKGSPLTEGEVLELRDGATVVMSKRSVVDAMAASRGYADIDPENVWPQWQRARLEAEQND